MTHHPHGGGDRRGSGSAGDRRAQFYSKWVQPGTSVDRTSKWSRRRFSRVVVSPWRAAHWGVSQVLDKRPSVYQPAHALTTVTSHPGPLTDMALGHERTHLTQILDLMGRIVGVC